MGEAIYHAIEFFLKCIFVYPFTLTWKGIRFFLDRRVPTPPVIPVKSRPATPAETQAAVTQLQLAHRLFMKAWDDRDYTERTMRQLTMASEAVNKARALDPGARVTVEQHKEQTTYTVDELSAHILLSQSELLVYGANLLVQELSSDKSMEALKEAQRKIHQYLRDAIRAAEAALRYQPSNVKYRLALARAYRGNSQKKEARKAVQEALELDPHNLDALELQAELGR